MPEFSRTILSLASAAFQKRTAQGEGGLLSGVDPTAFDTSDPLRLWIIQVGVIIMTAQLLSLVLAKMHQPKVIAEVLGGILLGPTAFGRIPGFTNHIFPEDSIPYLTLVANIGLVLFLFIVGLEIETAVIKRNARLSLPIALAGMILPFGLGTALSHPLYNQFIDPSVAYTHFMLFTGVAYTITAFPVLCRILTELKLVDTTVGIVVLSAGVCNDVVGWVLLALSVALANAASGVSAVWILLAAVGWVFVLLFPVRWFMTWLAHRTGSIENGPTTFFMTVTMLVVFGSAFYTDVIGVNAIFGGFLAGLVVPREGGLAITLTEKLEDMVTIIFLPLYFTLSGLSTNLGLLDNGITWGYTIAICVLALTGKFGGCTIAARALGFKWREATTIGTLMSCKGLVELIVLNVGLAAGILSQRVFSMFVLEALVLTFMTTPVVTLIYPPEHRSRATGDGEFKSVNGQEAGTIGNSFIGTKSSGDEGIRKTHFTVVLDKLEHLPGMMTLTQLIQPPPPSYPESENKRRSLTNNNPSSPSSSKLKNRAADNVVIDALRLIELSDRTSAVMKSSAADTLIHTDPLLGVFRTFGELHNLPITTSLSVVTFDDLAARVSEHARNNSSHLILVPWLPPFTPHLHPPGTEGAATPAPGVSNPFDLLFRSNLDNSASAVHANFVRGIFSQSTTDVALFVDRRWTSDGSGRYGGLQHLFLPFFGGPDDRLALEFIIQLCSNPKISATIVRLRRSNLAQEDTPIEKLSAAHLADGDHDTRAALANMREHGLNIHTVAAHLDTIYAPHNTQTLLLSETADNITWARYASPPPEDSPHPQYVTEALTRIVFSEETSPIPLQATLRQAQAQQEYAEKNSQTLMIVVGRSRRLAVEDHHDDLKDLMEEHGQVRSEIKKTIGDVASALTISGCNAGVIVVQAAERESL